MEMEMNLCAWFDCVPGNVLIFGGDNISWWLLGYIYLNKYIPLVTLFVELILIAFVGDTVSMGFGRCGNGWQL